MGLRKLISGIGMASLVLAPFSAAAGFIAVFARDMPEAASATLAVAAALSLASVAQLAYLTRETRRISEKQDEVRAQSLALARCMRGLNARLLRHGEEETDADVMQRTEPEVETRPADHAADHDEQADGLIPVVDLASRTLWGFEVAPAEPAGRRGLGRRLPGAADAALSACLSCAALLANERKGTILVAATAPLSTLRQAPALLLALVRSDASLCDRLLLGIPQSTLRSGAEVDMLAALARAGVRFALTDITDFRLDAVALRACNMVCVRIDAGRLLGASGDSLTAAATGAVGLGVRLASAGVDLICEGVSSPALIEPLRHLGVIAGAGTALRPLAETVIIPWRADANRDAPRKMPAMVRRAG